MKKPALVLSVAALMTLATTPCVIAADYSAPVISGESQIQVSELSNRVELFVTVTDDDLVQSVTLKYRKIGSKLEYVSLALPRVYFEKDVFGLVLDSTFNDDIDANYEYFIEAIDAARNITQQPFPKSPNYFYSNSTFKSSENQFDKKVSSGSTLLSGNKKWWAIGIGILASSLVLSKSGGSGGNSSGETSTITIITPIPNTK